MVGAAAAAGTAAAAGAAAAATQWSPTEPYVFASYYVDKTIAIWDTRLGKSPAASIKAHNADVNVISWNRFASCMLASGSDDGAFSIRDLRLLKCLQLLWIRNSSSVSEGSQSELKPNGSSDCKRTATQKELLQMLTRGLNDSVPG